MEHFLANIKTKPDAYKRRFAILIAALITGIVFMFWLVSFRVYLAEKAIQQGSLRTVNEKKGRGPDIPASAVLSTPPLESVIETVKQGWQGVADMAGVLEDTKQKE